MARATRSLAFRRMDRPALGYTGGVSRRSGERAQALAMRWVELRQTDADDDPGLLVGLVKTWADHENWPPAAYQTNLDLRPWSDCPLRRFRKGKLPQKNTIPPTYGRRCWLEFHRKPRKEILSNGLILISKAGLSSMTIRPAKACNPLPDAGWTWRSAPRAAISQSVPVASELGLTGRTGRPLSNAKWHLSN